MKETEVKSKSKEQKGITLIALVITIIVLLILAGISIATLTGENGVLTKANTAKKQTTVEEEKEQIKLAYNAALAENLENGKSTNITASDLQRELEAQGTDATVTPNSNPIKVTFNKTGNQYEIDGGNGKIEKKEQSEEEAKWEKILEEANANPDKYKNPEQQNSEAIGIGTDGSAINMDWWIYKYTDENNDSYALTNPEGEYLRSRSLWTGGILFGNGIF